MHPQNPIIVIEQLPLTLHRMFALLRELDDRYTCGYGQSLSTFCVASIASLYHSAQIIELQQTIRRYVSLRQTIDNLNAPPLSSDPAEDKSSSAVDSESEIADNTCTC
jgi:hypothetical protein